MLKKIHIIATICAFFALHSHAQEISAINDRAILDLLGSVEGPEGYTDIYRGSSLVPPKPITKMTVGEVLAFQDRMIGAGSISSAIGRYQFIRGTLGELVVTHKINKQQLFDKRVQDYLARMLLVDCGFYKRHKDDGLIGNCLARRWAALPVLTGEKAGASYYHGKAGNRALVTMAQVREVISDRFSSPEMPVHLARYVEWPQDGRNADRIPLSKK